MLKPFALIAFYLTLQYTCIFLAFAQGKQFFYWELTKIFFSLVICI